jgi:hypothetical protein
MRVNDFFFFFFFLCVSIRNDPKVLTPAKKKKKWGILFSGKIDFFFVRKRLNFCPERDRRRPRHGVASLKIGTSLGSRPLNFCLTIADRRRPIECLKVGTAWEWGNLPILRATPWRGRRRSSPGWQNWIKERGGAVIRTDSNKLVWSTTIHS